MPAKIRHDSTSTAIFLQWRRRHVQKVQEVWVVWMMRAEVLLRWDVVSRVNVMHVEVVHADVCCACIEAVRG